MKPTVNTRPKSAISLASLTPAQALLAALRVKPADLKAMKSKEKKEKIARRLKSRKN